ncbi:MAG TPA: GYD domain-containing protein [Candidatus Omnitrophota bacterium]|nr:GYD domain-containing protein [Candidatus Omnitrophota bacterium]HSA31866.1 GYD domain-containing protein [Candidatus Omnitrophota bacterium]
MTYVFIGKYNTESIKEISSERTDRALSLINQLGGKLISMYALLGGYDCVLIADFPDNKIAMKASLGLTLLTGISFSTCPAVSMDDFDRMLNNL